MKREIWHEIVIKASPREVYEAVTDIRKLSHWWTTDTKGKSAVGSHLEFWFDGACAAEMDVTDLNPDKLVRWRCTRKSLPDWRETKIEFKIFARNGRTVLHFRHSGWHEDAAMFPQCSLDWAIFLISLKEFVETGKGRPYPYNMPIVNV